MLPKFVDANTADTLARRVYDISLRCLMAHSIRAVEQHLREVYGFETTIVLQESKTVRSDSGRMSYCSVANNSGDCTYVFVQEDQDWENSKRRFCVAHELYHVIWSVGSSGIEAKRDQASESTCDVFANVLCGLHHAFYSKQENIDKIKFQGLPYKSV